MTEQGRPVPAGQDRGQRKPAWQTPRMEVLPLSATMNGGGGITDEHPAFKAGS